MQQTTALHKPLFGWLTCCIVALALGQLRLGVQWWQQVQPGLQPPQQQSASKASSHSPTPLDPDAWATTLRWFPQVQQCSTQWMHDYSQLHADMVAGRTPNAKWLVSVAAEAGAADRLSGVLTLFWTAVLSQRAFTELAYNPLPSFGAACDYPWINWTHPEVLPAAVVDPLKYTYKGQRGYGGDRSYNVSLVDTQKFHPLYLTTHEKRHERGLVRPEWHDNFTKLDLSRFPGSNPDVPYVIAGANRGRSYMMAKTNPHHRKDFWRMGITPDNAFMCGFFFLCSPNAAVQQLYQNFWKQLSEPGVLSIGIQVRFGDRIIKRDFNDAFPARTVDRAWQYFECAEHLERTHALPGQKVVWYLNSDSRQLRVAAKEMYGEKVITDTSTVAVHPDCSYLNPESCRKDTMDAAMQHAVGAMLTFSMTDFHVISYVSGFGRLPAWLSGKWDNLLYGAYRPQQCTSIPRDVSALHRAGV